MGLWGGKNSFFNKPLGAGKKSVNKVVENVIGKDAKKFTDFGATLATTGGALTAGKYLSDNQKAKEQAAEKKAAEAEKAAQRKLSGYLQQGEDRAEQLIGADPTSIGEERAKIRKQYEDILNGNSIAEKTGKAQRNAQLKSLKAQNAATGGGNQMSQGMQQAVNRQSASDISQARSQEYMDTLNKLETQYRGASGDYLKIAGGYGSLGVASQAVPTVQQKPGFLSGILDGLF